MASKFYEGFPNRKLLHVTPGMYSYDDMLMLGQFPASNLDQIREIEMSEQDVMVVGYPRSGTVWVQEILSLLHHSGNAAAADLVPLLQRFPAIEHHFPSNHHLGIINVLDRLRTREPPRFFKTRLPARFYQKQVAEGDTKAIVILRNPKDVLVSFFNFYRMNRAYQFQQDFETFFEMFLRKYLFWGDYFDHVISWWELRHRPNVLLVKYEDMKQDLYGHVSKMADFYGVSDTMETIQKITDHCQFESMRDNPATNFSYNSKIYDFSKAPFMRSGTLGGWRNYLTSQQSQLVDQMCEALLPKDLQFQFEL